MQRRTEQSLCRTRWRTGLALWLALWIGLGPAAALQAAQPPAEPRAGDEELPAGLFGADADEAGNDAKGEPVPIEEPEPPAVELERTEEGLELHAQNQPLGGVLELLGRLYKVNIVAGKNVQGTVTADLYNVHLEEVLTALCRANQLKWIKEDSFYYIHTPEEIDALRQDSARLESRVFPLNYLTAADGLALVEPLLSDDATTAVTAAAEAGMPSNASEVGGDNYGLTDAVIVRDFPENLDAVAKVLQKMDQRPRQVLIEATILQVTLDDETSLGVDFNALAGVDFRELGTAPVPSDDGTTTMADASDSARALMNPWGTAFTQGFADGGTGLNIGIITNNISVFVNALEEVTDTNILSNPKVLALNKQPAEVIVGQRLGYRTTTVTETTAIETIDFLDVGTQLRFRPFISDDGFVRMEVHPEVSSGTVVNELPNETTTEVTCNVMVKDGHTIVIGGLFDENTSIGRTQVPGLGNTPGIGWMFRNRADSTVRNEIVILLTPHIIDHEDASEIGEAYKEDFRRRLLGLREGFYFFSRERLTSANLEDARDAWRTYQETGNAADLETALWNVNLTLNVAPNNLMALRLKDDILTEKRGRPVDHTSWTLWDSLAEKLKAHAAVDEPDEGSIHGTEVIQQADPTPIKEVLDEPATEPTEAPEVGSESGGEVEEIAAEEGDQS